MASARHKMPSECTLAHICLDMSIKKAEQWGLSNFEELIVCSKCELQLLQNYRELKNRNNKNQNDRLTNKIRNGKYDTLQKNESTRNLYVDVYDYDMSGLQDVL